MITATPAVNIPFTVTLTSPFHHGAGTSGNTSLLRTQDVVQPDGTVSRVPFLSAASIRHGLRDALAWHLAQHAELPEGELSKTLVDLVWTGGAVTSTGSRTNLDMMRRVNDTLPMLGLLGYAAQSDITTGTLRASDLTLCCRENNWRHPVAAQEDKRAAAFRGEEFGTRHDQANGPVGRYLAAVDTEVQTAQMIWDTQTLITGARLHGSVSLTYAATPEHDLVLGAALALWAPDGEVMLGAKTAQGYGRGRIDGIDLGDCGAKLTQWTDMVRDNKQNIRDLLEELTQ